MGSVAVKVNAVGKKTKYYADKVYLYGLVFFLASQACALASTVSEPFYYLLFYAGIVLLAITGIYRIFFTLFEDLKTAFIAISAVLFGLAYFIYSVCTVYSNDALILLIVAVAIAGAIGVNADHILTAGIIGNAVMIINNIYLSIIRTDEVFGNLYAHSDFFYFGKNVFYFHRMNNRSSTDWASHYFWMIVAYLWIRGKKITWGEICAVGAMDILVYSLTGSNTSLVCITFALLITVVYKLYTVRKSPSVNAKTEQKDNALECGIKRIVDVCSKYSFVIMAAAMILLTVLYDIGNPVFYRLNLILHERLALGQRGIIENGIHLFASGVNIYGNFSLVDPFYNFLDSSYISVLVKMGLLPFAFYLGIMTSVQIRHRKYLYGALLLAVCALSCVEEHHLAEVPYNFFVLLLFADFDKEKTDNVLAVTKKKKSVQKISIVSVALSIAFIAGAVFVNYPRYKALKECDRLDKRAAAIYRSVQDNLDSMVASGEWQQQTALMNYVQLGSLIVDEPYDFHLVMGKKWSDMNKDPKVHAYYSICYDALENDSSYDVNALLISDDVKELIGGGSAVIEYDVAAGKVYSVWYSEQSGCHSIVTGRLWDRADRLMMKEGMEGYFAGDSYVQTV